MDADEFNVGDRVMTLFGPGFIRDASSSSSWAFRVELSSRKASVFLDPYEVVPYGLSRLPDCFDIRPNDVFFSRTNKNVVRRIKSLGVKHTSSTWEDRPVPIEVPTVITDIGEIELRNFLRSFYLNTSSRLIRGKRKVKRSCDIIWSGFLTSSEKQNEKACRG